MNKPKVSLCLPTRPCDKDVQPRTPTITRTGTGTGEQTTGHRGSWAGVTIQATYATSISIVDRVSTIDAAGAV